MERSQASAYAALVSVQLLFATLPVAGKLGMRDLDPLFFAVVRIGLAAVLLFALVAWLRSARAPPRRDLGRIAVYAFFGIALNQALFLVGLSRTTAINATLLIASIPVFTYAIALLARRERFDLRRALGIGVALGGVLVLLDPRRFDLRDDLLVGNLLVVANSLSYSLYLVISRPLTQRMDPLRMTGWLFVFGALFLLPLLFFVDVGVELAYFDPALTAIVAFVILGPTVGAYVLNVFALSRLESSTVAAFIYLQPLAAVALAALVLEEAVMGEHLLAGGLVLAGVALVTWKARTGKRRMVPVD